MGTASSGTEINETVKEPNVTNLKVTFRGMEPLTTLEAMAERAVRELAQSLRGCPWTSCQVTFESPPLFAAGDVLWLHVDASAPGREVSITRTQPRGGADSLEVFIKGTFSAVARDFRSSRTSTVWPALAAA